MATFAFLQYIKTEKDLFLLRNEPTEFLFFIGGLMQHEFKLIDSIITQQSGNFEETVAITEALNLSELIKIGSFVPSFYCPSNAQHKIQLQYRYYHEPMDLISKDFLKCFEKIFEPKRVASQNPYVCEQCRKTYNSFNIVFSL